MKGRHVAGPILVHGAYIAEISAFILILNYLDFSSSQKQWLFSAYSIALCLALPIGGYLSDCWGYGKTYLAGAALFVGSCSLMLVSGSFELLLFSRIAQGFSAGIFSPMVPLMLSDPKKDNGRVLAFWGGVSSIFSVCLPFTVGTLASGIDWKFAWLVIPTLALIGLICGFQRTTQTAPKEKCQIFGGRLTSVLGLIFFSFGISTLFLFSAPSTVLGGMGQGALLSILWVSSAATNFGISKHLTQTTAWNFSFAGVGLILVALAGLYLQLPYFSAVFCGIGLGLTNAPTTYLVLKHAPPSRHGLASSTDILSARLGGAVFVLLVPGLFVV